MKNSIITVSREFGSGGREMGERLAQALGVKYADREIVEALAQETELDVAYVRGRLEKGIASYPVHRACSFARIKQDGGSALLIAKQHLIVRQIASDNDCLIVGRGADAVLADMRPFRIFVYADMKSKIERCKKRMANDEMPTDKELERRIKSIDKARRSAHNLYAPYAWGDKAGYDLCINTTDIDIESIIPHVAAIAKNFFGENNL